MPKLRRLSGAEIIAILGGFGFTVHSQRGSHVKLRRVSPDGAI
ncbi:MAG: type II toxin-antitoxin system HicA family toxin [candidate division NC10 bacterium]